MQYGSTIALISVIGILKQCKYDRHIACLGLFQSLSYYFMIWQAQISSLSCTLINQKVDNL